MPTRRRLSGVGDAEGSPRACPASDLIFATSYFPIALPCGLGGTPALRRGRAQIGFRINAVSMRLNGWNRHADWVLCWVRRSRRMTLQLLQSGADERVSSKCRSHDSGAPPLCTRARARCRHRRRSGAGYAGACVAFGTAVSRRRRQELALYDPDQFEQEPAAVAGAAAAIHAAARQQPRRQRHRGGGPRHRPRAGRHWWKNSARCCCW